MTVGELILILSTIDSNTKIYIIGWEYNERMEMETETPIISVILTDENKLVLNFKDEEHYNERMGCCI